MRSLVVTVGIFLTPWVRWKPLLPERRVSGDKARPRRRNGAWRPQTKIAARSKRTIDFVASPLRRARGPEGRDQSSPQPGPSPAQKIAPRSALFQAPTIV